MDQETKRRMILNTVSDLVTDFTYYDRKESVLTIEMLNDALRTGLVTSGDIINKFSEGIRNFEAWVKANPEM